jgi:thiosulfate/3-mercaptopyruvate sulfurtransferase
MLPTAEHFAEEMGKLGVRKGDTVVVYDSAELGIFSAPRVAWMLKFFGHPSVHILNNFKVWVDQGFPVEKGEPEEPIIETNYPVPEVDFAKLMKFEELREKIKELKEEGAEALAILDARSEGRFDGTAEEPRAGKSIACARS